MGVEKIEILHLKLRYLYLKKNRDVSIYTSIQISLLALEIYIIEKKSFLNHISPFNYEIEYIY